MNEYVKLVEQTLEEGTTKEVAKTIRGVLKQKFPKTKFSVRMSRGSAVNVKWSDGPIPSSVEKHIQEYESIHRDEATYEILSGGNLFVFANREVSDANKKKITKLFDKEWDGGYGNASEFENQRFYESGLNYLIATTNFDKPLKVKSNPSGSAMEPYVGNSPKER
jgi:hypothetical protein